MQLTGTCSRCGKKHGFDPVSKAISADCAVASTGRYRASSTHVDGIRFASKTEAGLYEYAKRLGYIVIPHVRFPLHCLTSPGIPATWFTPDLLIWGGDDVLEAWEAKGAKACESRDYQLRARAFVRSYPTIPLRVFRKVGGEFVEDHNAAQAGR